MQVGEYENLIGETVVEQDSDLPSENVELSAEGLVGIERNIEIKYASTFEAYRKSWMKALYIPVPAVKDYTLEVM